MNTFQLVNLPNIPNSNHLKYSRIERASNGAIYFAAADGLHVLNAPNEPADASISLEVPVTINLSDLYQNSAPVWQDNFGQYLLPDQMDFDPNCQIGCYSYTCGDNSSDEACCNFYSAFVTNSFHDIKVSNNAFWQPNGQINGVPFTGGTIKVGGNILIEPGVTLDIKDLRIEFSPTSKVIVSRGASSSSSGARLNIDKSILTVWENCGDCYMWRGIEAQGYNSIQQSDVAQARVSMINGTRIEYAHYGVVAGRITNGNMISGFTHGGARINANNTTFLNNRFDVVLTSYPNFHNSSGFLNSNFLTDNNLKSNIVTNPVHINMWNNRGVIVQSCTFENETPIVEGESTRGVGIQAVNSNFAAWTWDIQNPTKFNNLEYGIRTFSNNNALNYVVFHSQFKNNLYGIYSQGERNPIIRNNTFDVYNFEHFDTPLQETYGVYLEACNRYQVNNNLFKPNTQLTKDVHVFGCVVDNSGPFTNEISQNNFQGLHTGGVTRRQNASISGQKRIGLQWLCNSFTNDSKSDVWVQSGANLNQIQGTVIQSLGGGVQLQTAGNIFNTQSAPLINWRMENDVPPIWYLHYQQFAPMSVTNNVSIAHTGETRVCGRIINLPPHQPEEDGRVTRLSLYDDKRSVDEQIDFGDTDSLILEVLGEYLTPEQKRDLLKQQSISISDEVLIKYMESNPAHQHLYQVLVYNSPITDKAMYHMMEHTDLPNGMKQQIVLLQTGLSDYEAKSQISQEYELDIRYLENKLFEYALSDSTNQHPFEQLIFMYEESPEMNLEVMENLFNLYLISENVTKADSINTILKGTVNDPNYAYMNDLAVASLQMDYYTLLQDSNIVLTLESIAELYDYRDAARAQALLSGYLGYEFEPLTAMGAKTMVYPKYTYDGSVLETISVFPNPAQDHFFIVFDENADVTQIREVKVFDLSGVLQFTREMKANDYVLEIKTENMAKGMYLVTISAEGKEISTQKVAVR
jgi:hypothetical protein